MASTPTTRNRFEKQSLGSNRNTWGAPKLNNLFDQLDESLDGVLPLTLTGPVTLTSVAFADDQARQRVLVLTGALTQAAPITVPSVEKWYWVINATTGGYAVTVATAGGTAATIPAYGTTAIYCDGVDCHVMRNLGAGSERFRNVATATDNTDAVNKAQMDAAIAGAVIPGASGTVKVTSSDTTPAFLSAKIATYGDLQASVTSPSGNEGLSIRRVPPAAGYAATWTLAASDTGSVFTVSGSFSLSMTAAATLGAGWNAIFRKTDDGAVVLDPSGSELIDADTSLTLYRNDIVELRCTGAGFQSIGGRDRRGALYGIALAL